MISTRAAILQIIGSFLFFTSALILVGSTVEPLYGVGATGRIDVLVA